jgi:DNA adenine methylase
MKPIIKWAGGKTQLLEHIRAMMPKNYNHYFEPFLGGGAVLLNLTPNKSTVNDINTELVNMYKQIRHNPDEVIEVLSLLDAKHEIASNAKAYYYAIRELFNANLTTDTPEQAARLIYINKHCFNGLYRVNAKGLFNVPFNNKLKGDSFDEMNIRQVSSYLQNVEIVTGDFESSLEGVKSGDFVFFDSPYVPLNPTSFTDYTKEGFDYEDHLRLANLYKRLSEQGVYCMLTNHNAELVNELYKDFNIKVVQVSRNINSKASARKGEEVIITNYEL